VSPRSRFECHLAGIDPDRTDAALAPDDDVADRPPHHGDHIAGPVDRAEEHDARPGEARRDADEVAGEVGDERLRRRRRSGAEGEEKRGEKRPHFATTVE
jgi:hypothetical protein